MKEVMGGGANTQLDHWFDANEERLLDDVATFVGFPSVASQKEHLDDLLGAANCRGR